jgi:hypothetical protein
MSRESIGAFASIHQAFSDSFDVIKARTLNEIPNHFVHLPSVEQGPRPGIGFSFRETRLKFDRLQREMDDLIHRIASETLGLMTIQEFPASRVSGISGGGVQVRVESVHKYVLQFIELFQINSDNFFQIVRNDYFQTHEAAQKAMTYHGSIQRGTTTLQAVEFLERFDMARNSVFADSTCRAEAVPVPQLQTLPVDHFTTSLDKKVIVSEVMDGEQPSQPGFLESEVDPNGLRREHDGTTQNGNRFEDWKDRIRGHRFLRSSFLEVLGDTDQNDSFSSALREKLEGYYAKRLKPLEVSEEDSRNLSDVNFEIHFSDFEDHKQEGGRKAPLGSNGSSQCLFSDVLDEGQPEAHPSTSTDLFKKKGNLMSEVENDSVFAFKNRKKRLEIETNFKFCQIKAVKSGFLIDGPLQLFVAGKTRFSGTFGNTKPANLSLFCPQSPKPSHASGQKRIRNSAEKENLVGEVTFGLKPPSQSELDSAFVEMAMREFDARERFENSQRKLKVALSQLAILNGKPI